MRKITLAFLICMLCALTVHVSKAQKETQLLFMANDTSEPRLLTASETEQLADPFFQLVLKNHPEARSLTHIESLLQPDATKISTFVVHEAIVNPKPRQGRRAVIAFAGMPVEGNVMMSVSFNFNSFKDTPGALEVWGWDSKHQAYNYYRLDSEGTGFPSWKFRGSSKEADTLSASERQGTCMACHLNGAPIMRELLFPWNNWHSFKDRATYLDGTSSELWPVSSDPKIKDRLRSAEELETMLISSIRRFNLSRIRSSIASTSLPEVSKTTNGQRLLRPLFETTEFNIISSGELSGLHPFDEKKGKGPSRAISIPDSFFLNANLIGTNSLLMTGLGIEQANKFSSAIKVTPQEYIQLVQESGVQLHHEKPGDTRFAWLVPEPGIIDVIMVQELMNQGIVTPEFVAAVHAIELEKPILSRDRGSLLRFVPTEFTFQTLKPGTDPLTIKRHPDELTLKVIASLEAIQPEPGTPEEQFLSILKMNDPIKELEQRVNVYHETLVKKLNSPKTRQLELEKLYGKAVRERLAIMEHPLFGVLDETGGTLLFAVP